MNMHEDENCATLQSVKDIEVDSRGHLWVIDHSWKNCRSRIWIFDLNNNDVSVLVHDLPDYVYSLYSLGMYLGSLAVYEAENDTFAFIVERNYNSVVVFSLESKKTWIVRIGGISLSGIALSTVGKNKLLYLSSWLRKQPGLYVVLVSDLVERKNKSLTPTLIGNKTSGSFRLIIDRKGMLFFDIREKTVLCARDTSALFEEEVVHQDEQLSPVRWYSRFTVDELDDVWLLIRFDGGFKLLTSGVVAELVDRKFDIYEDEFVPEHRIFYSPRNAVVGDIAVYGDRLFISFPKMNTIPVTLTSLHYESELLSPPLQPFPSRKMHKETAQPCKMSKT
ncbi:Hypothetical predicted protein [Cloeon dipterum]|uniref:Bee-milk protein n=1 Tax=Cloeon dipterum TaxID=197152 RepID=A0A8S1DT82_9INSE|nr:Hypothetical predicted protein [Cloeon dipterum]